MLWDLNEGKHLYTLHAQLPINALVFSPNRYWLCAATGSTVKIWVSSGEISPPSISPSVARVIECVFGGQLSR